MSAAAAAPRRTPQEIPRGHRWAYRQGIRDVREGTMSLICGPNAVWAAYSAGRAAAQREASRREPEAGA